MTKIFSIFLVLLQIFSTSNFLIQSSIGAALFAISSKAIAVDSSHALPTQPVTTPTNTNNVGSNDNYNTMFNYGKSLGDSFRETGKALSPAVNNKVNTNQMDFTQSIPSNLDSQLKDPTKGVTSMNDAFSGFGYDSANSNSYINDYGGGKYGDTNGLDSLLADKSSVLSTQESPQGEVYRMLTSSKPRTKFAGATNQITQQSSNALATMEANKAFTTCKTVNPGTPTDHFCGQNNLDNQTCYLERDLKSKKLITLTQGSDVRKGSISSCGPGCYQLKIGDPSDNNVCGWGDVYQTVTAEVFDPDAITEVKLTYVLYDDFLKVMFNDKVIWEDWGAGERGTTWTQSLNVDATSIFVNEAKKNPKVNLTSVLGAYGCGEGYYDIIIKYDISKALLESEWETNNTCFQNGLRIHNNKCTGNITCETDFMSISEIELSPTSFQIPSLFNGVSKTCKKIKVQTNSCQKVNVSTGSSVPAHAIISSGNNLDIVRADTVSASCPLGTRDEGEFCRNIATGVATLKPITKRYCDIGKYRSNSVGVGDNNGNYCTNPVYTTPIEDPTVISSWSALGACDAYTLNENCQFMSSTCGLKDFASGTCQISKNKFTCQTPGTMVCTNEGSNPFVKCVETTSTVTDTINTTLTDPRSCFVVEPPSKGSCSFTNNWSVTTVNDVITDSAEDPCEMYYSYNAACKVLSSSPVPATSNKRSTLSVATYIGVSSDPNVTRTTEAGSTTCSIYTKDNACQALSTYSCSDTLGFTDANAPLMPYTGYKGLPKVCKSVSVNYNCHTNNRMSGTAEDGNFYAQAEGIAMNQCTTGANYDLSGNLLSKSTAIESDPACKYQYTTCDDGESTSSSGECYMKTKHYECGEVKGTPVTKTLKSNSCAPGAPELNTSFANATANLSALQQIANESKDCDGSSAESMRNCEIFKGKPLSCKRDMFGGALVNCCDMPSGVDLSNYIGVLMTGVKMDNMMMSMSDTMVGGAWANYVHNPIADTLSNFGDTAMSYATKTWDSISTSFTSVAESFTGSTIYDPGIAELFDHGTETMSVSLPTAGSSTTSFFGEMGAKKWAMNQARDFLVNTFSEQTANLFFTGSQGNIALGGAIGGPLSMMMTIYMYYQMVMMIAQMIWQCKQEEQELAAKKDMKVCHLVKKNYCHAYLNCTFCKICIEYRDRYCCFSSPLARIMMQQIKPQLGMSWGSGKHPNCSGLRIDDVGRVDFSAINLTEWISLLKVSNVIPSGSPNFQNMTGTGNTVWNNLTPDRKNVYERTEERMADMQDNKVDQVIEGLKDGVWNSGKN